MELEQRVKTLEYEMKIVKNEIQRTLLDIQEQVLIHYYPSLRLEETSTPKNVLESVEGIRGKQSQPEAPAPDAPVVKKISLDEARTVANHVAPGGSAEGAVNVVKLVDWATASSTRIGGERAARLIEVYAKKSFIPSDMRGVLLQVTSLFKSSPTPVAVNEIIGQATKLDAALGRPVNPEEAIAMIEEAGLG